jgi:hypothetical protein
MAKKLIVLEFNELCPQLLHAWMESGELPNFRRFLEGSNAFTATADEPGPENLEPWIQWYSMHTGVPFRVHGVRNLTDGPTASYPDVWRMLLSHGYRVADFGSMNVRQFEAPGSLFVPDPWCADQSPYPEQWSAYHDVVGALVRERSAKRLDGLSPRRLGRFARFLASNGIRPRTVGRAVAQVMSDTVLRRDTRWRRASLLDRIQCDLFRKYWMRHRPDFSSFFVNSTAHYQHAYWYYAFPDQYQVRPSDGDIAKYGTAILHGYRQMDALLGDFFELERQGAALMLCTALSQQSLGDQRQIHYRLRSPGDLLSRLSLEPVEVLTVMAQQLNLRFRSAAEAERAKAVLLRLRVAGRPVFLIDPSEPLSVFFGCAMKGDEDEGAEVLGFPDGGTLRFGDLFYRMSTEKATVHHPDSFMWFKTGRHVSHEERVSILDWFPTVLEMFSVDQPLPASELTYGRSFLARIN